MSIAGCANARRILIGAALAAALAATACSAAEESTPKASSEQGSTAVAGDAASTSTTSTTLPPTTTTIAPAPAPEPTVLRPGDEGDEVVALQEYLQSNNYDIAEVNGRYDEATQHAVMAFQKVHGLSRDGFAGPETRLTMLAVRGRPNPLVPDGEGDRAEVDLARQVAMLYKGGALTHIVSVSTGNEEVFCSQGRCRRAMTPTGRFEIGRRASGWETGPLGRLYNPLYFNGGIAFHGSLSVPATAASHGCVRLPMNTAEWFPDAIPKGMAVYVVDGRVDEGLDHVPPPIPDLGSPRFDAPPAF